MFGRNDNLKTKKNVQNTTVNHWSNFEIVGNIKRTDNRIIILIS